MRGYFEGRECVLDCFYLTIRLNIRAVFLHNPIVVVVIRRVFESIQLLPFWNDVFNTIDVLHTFCDPRTSFSCEPTKCRYLSQPLTMDFITCGDLEKSQLQLMGEQRIVGSGGHNGTM